MGKPYLSGSSQACRSRDWGAECPSITGVDENSNVICRDE
jgi:hypothetical protein